MLSEIAQKTTSEIAQELRRTLDPPSAGGHPLAGSSPRVGAVEGWLDLRRAADGPARRKIDDAIQQALTTVLFESAVAPETVCAHLRLLRLAAQEKAQLGRVSKEAKRAVLGAIQSERYKGVQTSYGDTHAELLACVEVLRLAPNWEFWHIQMYDDRYVAHAVSGCLGSDNEQWALSGVIRAAILGDRSLVLALMRLFRMFDGRESLVWDRFGEARRSGAWSQEVFDRVSRSMAQIGQSCPSDHALRLEQEAARLRQRLAQTDQLLKAAEAKATLAVEDREETRLTLSGQLDQLEANQQQYKRIVRQIEQLAKAEARDLGESRSSVGQPVVSEPEGIEVELWAPWCIRTIRSTIGNLDRNLPRSKRLIVPSWSPEDAQRKKTRS